MGSGAMLPFCSFQLVLGMILPWRESSPTVEFLGGCALPHPCQLSDDLNRYADPL